MNQISVMNLRENQILAGASMESVLGGHTHTGDATTCKNCSKVLPGTENGGGGIAGAIVTYSAMLYCWVKSKFQD